jgi:uncharacterized protein
MEHKLTAGEKTFLIRIAREAIMSSLEKGEIPRNESATPRLEEKRGCFVCIKIDGKLRGCIGNFISDKPLHQLVQEMAVAAATRDPRFYPMKKKDLANFDLEISVLSPLQKVTSIEDVQVGVHGLYIEKNFARGVLLPQVAVEYGWDRDTFLGQTCVKAGLNPDDWKEGATIYRFSAEVFS